MANYLKKFNLHEQYNSFLGGVEFVRPNVSLITDDGTVYYNPVDKRLTVYIDGVEFKVEPGLTWKEYLEENYEYDMLNKNENDECFYYLDGISFYNDNIMELASGYSMSHNALNDKFETILGDKVIENGEKLYFEGEMNFKIDDMCFRTINGFTWRETFNWKLYWNPFDCSGESPIGCGYQDEDNYVTIYYTIPDELWGGVCFGTPENNKKIRIKYEDGTYVQCDDVIIQDYNYVINWGEEIGWTE